MSDHNIPKVHANAASLNHPMNKKEIDALREWVRFGTTGAKKDVEFVLGRLVATHDVLLRTCTAADILTARGWVLHEDGWRHPANPVRTVAVYPCADPLTGVAECPIEFPDGHGPIIGVTTNQALTMELGPRPGEPQYPGFKPTGGVPFDP